MADEELKEWFLSVVLPLEPQLVSYLRRFGDRSDEVRDMLHDVYEKALVGAGRQLPRHGKAYVFAIARNTLITRAKRAKIVRFELIADFEDNYVMEDPITPERHVEARVELQRALDGINNLPPRCREMVRLRKVEGLTTKEVAERLNVSTGAVERQMTLGMRALADCMLGGDGAPRRTRPKIVRLSRKDRSDV